MKIRQSKAAASFFIDGHIPWNKGKTHSEETKSKLRLIRETQTDPRLGTHHSPESKLKMRLAKLGKKQGPRSEEWKAKIREARLRQVLPVKDTSIELLMQEELAKRNVTFLTHVPLEHVTQADIVLPDQKVAIFCDGCYWHECSSCGLGPSPRKNVRQRDARITHRLRETGWTVYRFWEHEIHEDVDGCIAKISTKQIPNFGSGLI